jgi:hypothetical protein
MACGDPGLTLTGLRIILGSFSRAGIQLISPLFTISLLAVADYSSLREQLYS